MTMSRRFRSLPLFWKLLIPFLVLVLVLGASGAFLITRDLSSRAQETLDRELSRRSLEASAAIRSREFYMLESANLAANLEGMREAIRSRDATAIDEVLRSVRALKTDLDLLVVTDVTGRTLIGFRRERRDGVLGRSRASVAAEGFVAAALAGTGDAKTAGFMRTGTPMLAIAAPVCATTGKCSPVGLAIVGLRVEALAEVARGKQATTAGPHSLSGVTIFDGSGAVLAASGTAPQDARPPAQDRVVRRIGQIGSSRVATLYTPLDIQGRPSGTLAVTQGADPAYSSVWGTALRLSLILLAAMAAVVVLGAALSRFILAQVRPLIATNRALGRGDLSARAPVLGTDELGELARGVNQMAEQLQASVETLESRVAQRTEEVQRLLTTRTEFFASLSHEFRTPLAVILGQADRVKAPAEAGETIRQAARQLLSVVNDILELAAAETGVIAIDMEDVSLHEFVRELRGTINGLAHGAGLTAVVDVAADVPAVRADRVRLREILLNLIDNAVKYTPEGGTVTLRAEAAGDAVAISVADTGVGIPSEAFSGIFEPFFRVAGSRPMRGERSTGLGLALTKRLVEAQGGSIAVQSAPGVGSTFTVSLPQARSDRPTRRRRNARPPHRSRGSVAKR